MALRTTAELSPRNTFRFKMAGEALVKLGREKALAAMLADDPVTVEGLDEDNMAQHAAAAIVAIIEWADENGIDVGYLVGEFRRIARMDD
jgi:hypothetical protein